MNRAKAKKASFFLYLDSEGGLNNLNSRSILYKIVSQGGLGDCLLWIELVTQINHNACLNHLS